MAVPVEAGTGVLAVVTNFHWSDSKALMYGLDIFVHPDEGGKKSTSVFKNYPFSKNFPFFKPC